jgi:hypothetical protein
LGIITNEEAARWKEPPLFVPTVIPVYQISARPARKLPGCAIDGYRGLGPVAMTRRV